MLSFMRLVNAITQHQELATLSLSEACTGRDKTLMIEADLQIEVNVNIDPDDRQDSAISHQGPGGTHGHAERMIANDVKGLFAGTWPAERNEP